MILLPARTLSVVVCMSLCSTLLVADSGRPIISGIDIMEQPVNFSRLDEESYRNTLPFGDRLLSAFDTINPFSDCPDKLDLPHDLNTITVHFSYPDWKSPHKIQYTHLLEGRDTMWSEPSEQPYVVFRNLPPGDYALLIKARDGSGAWSMQTKYDIAIRKPWWATVWARAGLIVLIFALVAFLVSIWLQRRSEVREMQQLLEAYRKAQLSLPVNNGGGGDKQDGFLRLINHTLEEHLSDENFGIAELCELLNISRTQLHRKLKKRTGLSTSHYIRFLRLQMASEMFRDPNLNVSEVAFAVGFSNAAYFSRVFKAQYGISPSEAREQLHQ